MPAMPAPQTGKRTKRIRLEPDERERRILEGAIQYFAENGFDGQIRGLAKQLGVSQGLIYRYFPNKDALIDRVYQAVFLNRWDLEWERILRDRSADLRSRLKRLYKSYSHAVDRNDVIRISVYSALKNERIGRAYLGYVRDSFILPIAEEIRHAFALPSPAERPISMLEEQLVFSLHAKLVYALVRKHVYNFDIGEDADFLTELYVDGFCAGLRECVQAIMAREDGQS